MYDCLQGGPTITIDHRYGIMIILRYLLFLNLHFNSKKRSLNIFHFYSTDGVLNIFMASSLSEGLICATKSL